jgi:hypothetical protein
MDRDRVTGVIGEEFFSGLVVLMKRDVERLCPVPVPKAELAVLIAFGVFLSVLVPKELKGDLFSSKIRVDVIEGRHVPSFRTHG